MKKLTAIIILGIFLIGIATSITLGINRDSELDKTYKDKIDDINEEPIERGDIFCDKEDSISKTCHQIIKKGNETFPMVHIKAKKCEGYEEINNRSNATRCTGWIDLTEEEIKTNISIAGNEMLEKYAISLIKEDAGDDEIEDSGIIILKDKRVISKL